jgi:hypothetical protein
MRTRTRTTPAMVQRAYELAARGWHHDRIARELGNSASCVSRILLGQALPKAPVILTAAALAELPGKYRKTPRQITASPAFRHCFTCKATYRTAEEARKCYAKHEPKDAKKLTPAQKIDRAIAIGHSQAEAEGREIQKQPAGRDELLELQDETFTLYSMEADLVSRWASWGLDERDVRDLGRILTKLEVRDQGQLRLRLVGGES